MTFQEQLDALQRREAPLPLTNAQGNVTAFHLRQRGMTYGHIRIIMADYHGLYMSEHGWRTRLRVLGAEPRHYAHSAAHRVPPQNRPPS